MTRRPRMRGAALLLVLWLIVLLATLVGTFAVAARVENQQGRLLSRGLVADQAARAAAWDSRFASWFPEGPTDVRLALLEVQVTAAECVEWQGRVAGSWCPTP